MPGKSAEGILSRGNGYSKEGLSKNEPDERIPEDSPRRRPERWAVPERSAKCERQVGVVSL